MQHDFASVVTILEEAKRLNSELGHHVRSASFSKHLSGRFYRNNSLESHKARSDRVSKMREERRRLENFLKLEEKKIHFLEQKLYEKQMERRKEDEKRRNETLSSIKIQTVFRRSTCINQLILLRIERDIKIYLVIWLQSRFRGRRDRMFALAVKDGLAKIQEENAAAITIQTQMRMVVAKIRLNQVRQKIRESRCFAAIKLQSLSRGYIVRHKVKLRRKEVASTEIQRLYRGHLVRKNRHRQRKRKPKRIPLHERRYSSYGAVAPMDLPRNFSMSSTSDVRFRRASLPGWDVLRKAVATSSINFQPSMKYVVDRVPQRVTHIHLSDSSFISKSSSLPDDKNHHEKETISDVVITNRDEQVESGDESHTRQIPSQSLHKNQNIIAIVEVIEAKTSSEDFKRDKIIKSQLSAAKRALALSKKKEKDQEEKVRKEVLRKFALEKLEENRRNKIKEELEAKKEKQAKKSKERKRSFPIENRTNFNNSDFTVKVGGANGISNVTIAKEQKLLVLCQRVIVDASFLDSPFEDDFSESEFDLDSQNYIYM